ncbi:MAG: hypothetical protein BWY63_02714 [Chloroflexi bacterium ADurb.Bin360]|nr:MAG: hypothetical protein BWY63_02714 [Chloroflexi bacterium ADurb.Bin360]
MNLVGLIHKHDLLLAEAKEGANRRHLAIDRRRRESRCLHRVLPGTDIGGGHAPELGTSNLLVQRPAITRAPKVHEKLLKRRCIG